MATILLIDDSELVLQMLQMVCDGAGYQTVTVSAIADAERVLAGTEIAAVVTDLNMPDTEDPVAQLQGWTKAPIIVVSGRPQAELDEIAAERGAEGAVSKDAGMMGMAQLLPDLLERLL